MGPIMYNDNPPTGRFHFVKTMIMRVIMVSKGTARGIVYIKYPIVAESPLPPLNFRNGLHKFPTTEAAPVSGTKYTGIKVYLLASHITKTGFKKSGTNVKIPGALPATQSTFVAPIFFVPNFLTSIFFVILPMRNPTGIPSIG